MSYQVCGLVIFLFNYQNSFIMELEITHFNNFFTIKGILNKRNLDVFNAEFSSIFERLDSLTISIENVEWMDKSGVNALADLHYEALAKNKKMAIVGLGCKDLYEHFNSNALV